MVNRRIQRQGNVCVLVAVCLTVLLGVVAFLPPVSTPALSKAVLALESVADVQEPGADAERGCDERRVRVRAKEED